MEEGLAEEVILGWLSKLGPFDLLSASAVSRQWRRIGSNNNLHDYSLFRMKLLSQFMVFKYTEITLYQSNIATVFLIHFV
jgi:hypothetical protein